MLPVLLQQSRCSSRGRSRSDRVLRQSSQSSTRRHGKRGQRFLWIGFGSWWILFSVSVCVRFFHHGWASAACLSVFVLLVTQWERGFASSSPDVRTFYTGAVGPCGVEDGASSCLPQPALLSWRLLELYGGLFDRSALQSLSISMCPYICRHTASCALTERAWPSLRCCSASPFHLGCSPD